MKAPRHLAGALVAFLLAGLLGIFIALPIGAVLVESFDVSGPLPPRQLAALTEDALDLMPEAERGVAVARWVEGARQTERIEAIAAAFELAGLDVPWSRTLPFDRQEKAMQAALDVLAPAERQAVEEAYPTALIMLHKRIALAFAVRDRITAAEFERLRAGTDDRYGYGQYLKVIQDSYLRQAALNSLRLAAASVLFTVTIGFALAYAINRGGVPRPAFVRGVLLMPLVAPPVLVATATMMLFGRRGLVTHGLLDRTLGLIDADTANIYGPLGVVLAQTLSFLPATLIVIDNVLRRQDGRLEEAALNLGGGRGALFRHVTLPLAWPGIKRAIVLVFIMSLTDFGNPLILGRDTPVLAGIIYDEITAFQNTPLAAAVCVWLIAPSLVLYLLLEQVGRRKRYVTAESAGASEHRPAPAVRAGLTLVAGVIGFLILAIYLTILLGSVTRVWGVDWSLTLGYYTAAGVDVGHQGSGYGSSDRGLGTVLESLEIVVVAAPLGGLLALVIAYVVERLRPPGADIIAFLALVPAILPGIIFGIGYIIAFNAPFGVKALSLTGTSAILILNIVFGNLFVGVLAARGALQRLDRAVDEAAESLGAGLVRRFATVTLPMLRPAFLLGTLYVFIDGLTTLSSVIFLVSGNHQLAAVSIFNSANSASYGYAAAKSVAILALAVSAMALAWIVERRSSRSHRTDASGTAAGWLGFRPAALADAGRGAR